ncbi:MAG TPA: hypothetical protein VHT95_03150 [Vicinamibacterales bacterium]|jgi:hypothetical protein|nr:hypothetical protein [Vicinamibacterales bacterium]
MADAEGSPHRGVMIVLAYLWPLALVPLLLEKHDPDLQWHARHGLVLMLAELLLIAVYLAIASVVSLAALGLGTALAILLVATWIGVMALHVMAIVKGVSGTRLIVPGLSEHADARRHG